MGKRDLSLERQWRRQMRKYEKSGLRKLSKIHSIKQAIVRIVSQAFDVTESISFQLSVISNPSIKAVRRIYLKNVIFDDIDSDWRAR